MKSLLEEKVLSLKKYIESLESVAVSFSGGVDSSFLLKIAHDVLLDNAIAIMVTPPFFPERERVFASSFTKSEKINLFIIEDNPLLIPGFSENQKDRCYICKKNFLEKIKNCAFEKGIKNVLEGSNVDDEKEWRPGLKAVKELKVLSPLKTFGFHKSEIRLLLKEMGLSFWDKPSFTCLATRFPFGDKITEEKIEKVNRIEENIFSKGIKLVRARVHGSLCRIEVMKEDFEKVISFSDEINALCLSLGFSFVSLDLGGYRSGSMNEV